MLEVGAGLSGQGVFASYPRILNVCPPGWLTDPRKPMKFSTPKTNSSTPPAPS